MGSGFFCNPHCSSPYGRGGFSLRLVWIAGRSDFRSCVLVLFPLGCWRTFLVIAADRVFRLVILPRHQDVLLRRFRVPFSPQTKYFLGSPSFPNSILWRMLQTVSVVFLFASTATPLLATIRTPTIEEDWFFGLA